MLSFKEDLLLGLQQAYVSHKQPVGDTVVVETEFGDTVPAPDAQTTVPQVAPPDMRTQIMQQIEEQQRGIDSTYQANVSRWREEKAEADRWPVFGVGRMGVPLSRADTRPEAQKQLAAAAAELKRARKEAETYTKTQQKQDQSRGKERSWLSQLWDGATNLSPDKAVDILTGGMASTSIDGRINPILETKARGEELTDTELAVVQARRATQDAQRYVAEQGGATTAYSIGGSLPGTAQFMVETAATGGSLGVGKAVVGGGAKAIGQALGGAAVKEAVRTPLRGSMWQGFEERTGDQYVVGESGEVIKDETPVWERAYKSYMSTFAEGFTEQLGNVAGSGFLAKGAGKIAPKLLGKKMGGALVNGAERLAKATEGVRDVFKKTTNYNGTFDEFAEELVNNIIEPILTGEPERIKENFSSENMLVTLGSVALVGSAMHAANLPSIARYEVQNGKLRKQTNGAVAAIEDQTLRQGVFDALKKGQTVEQKATQLASLDWNNVSQSDAAHVVDAFSSNLRHELFKGVDQEQSAQEEYARQYALFNTGYGKIAHQEVGTVQEVLDDEGNSYYLLAGSLDGAAVDNTLFVYNAQTGQNEQLDRSRINYVEPTKTYGESLNEFNRAIGIALAEQTKTADVEEFDSEAAEAGVAPVTYAQGEVVELSDGRTGDFIGYLPDGATARVAILDEKTGEPNTIEVHRNQVVGLAEAVESTATMEQPTQTQSTTASPAEVQAAPTPSVPLQKDGTPDYEAMSAEQFLEHYGNEYSREEAVAELAEARELLEKQLAGIGKSNSANLNTRAKNKAKATAIQRRINDITSAIGEKVVPIAIEKVPSIEARMDNAPKRLSVSEQLDGYDDPVSLRDYILREIAQGKKFRWKDEGSSRGVASALGFVGNERERRSRIGLLKKDGDTPERYAEHLTAEVAPQFGITQYSEVRDEVEDILRSVNSRGKAIAQLEARHDNLRKQQEDYAAYAEHLQERAEKEVFDASVALDEYLSQMTEAEFAQMSALFAEELLPLKQDGSNEQSLQQPAARSTETGAQKRDFTRNEDSRTQWNYGEGRLVGDDQGSNLRSGAIGPVGSGRSGSGVEPTQQSDGIEQATAVDPSDVRFSELSDADISEMDRIKSDALIRGDFMRAPNGNPTNLTEHQWLQVRTTPFKEWFGDWEHAARIEKLRMAEPISITGEEITPSDDLKQYKRNALEYGKSLRGEYINADTGTKIVLSRESLTEILHHDYKNTEHLQSIAAIPQIIEKSIFIAEEKSSTNDKIDHFEYFVSGLIINGESYTVKSVVTKSKDGTRYYDHKLTQIEKGELISLMSAISSTVSKANNSPLSDIKDKRLLSILQVDASKIVDENGEPLVVYHGARTANEYFAFGKESYFTDNLDTAKMFDSDVSHTLLVNDVAHPIDLRSAEDIKNAIEPFEEIEWAEGWDLVEAGYAIDPLTETVRAVLNMDQDVEIKSVIFDLKKTPIRSLFLNIRNPQVKDYNGKTWGEMGAVIEQDIDNNGDGFIARNIREGGLAAELLDGSEPPVQTTYVTYHPNQIKSATDNSGEFSAQTDDIRFKGDVADQTFSETERQQKHEASKLAKEQSDIARRAEIDAALQKLTEKFGAATVQVDTTAELPAPLRAATKGRRFAGLYHKPSGAVYLIGSELRDADHATATYLHEVVAHKGIDGLLGQERATQFYAAVFDALKPEEQTRLLDRHGDKSIAGDEVVARMAEGDVTPGTMQRIIAAVRRFFREVLGVPLTISDTDIRYILFKSKISLQRTNNLTDAMRAIEADQRMLGQLSVAQMRLQERRTPIEKLRSAEPVLITGNEIEPSDDLKQYRRNALEYGKTIRGAYTNKDTGQDIRVSRESITEVLSHSIADTGHIASVAAIPDVIENATYITTLSNEKQRSGVVSYDYYACGLKIGGVDYTVKMVVANTGLGDKYYDHKLTEIEKGRLLDLIQSSKEEGESTPVSPVIHKSGSGINPPLSEIKDTRLISILQNNLLEDIEQNDIRYSEVKPLRQPIPHRVAGNKGRFGDKGRIGKAVEQIGSAAVQVQEALQDATIKVHLLQNEIKQGGGTITPLTNAYEALNHVDSRADAEMRKYKRHYMDPIVDHIKQWRKDYGLEYDEVTDYLLAKHSLERHASGINALDEKEGGKWTKEHATKQVGVVESVVSEAELTAFWADWRKATHQVLEIAVQSGRMSLDEKREILGKGWQYYVPLRGKDFDFEEVADMRDVFYYEMNRGQGGTSVSDRIAKAKGRSSKAANPIAMLQHMAYNEIYLSAQNNARRTLLRLVEANPQRTDLFAVRQKWYVKSPDGLWAETDQTPDAEKIRQSVSARKALRTEKDPVRRAELQEQITVSLRERDASKVYTGAPEDAHFVSVMKDGIRYTVKLVDPEVAAAINYKAGGVQRLASKYVGRPTRIMAQLNTSKNPAFILPNFVRDMQQAALYNLVDSEGNIKGFMNHALGSWKILDRNLRGLDRPLTAAELGTLDITNQADRAQLIEKYGKDRVNDTLYDLFAANGGETGYVHIADPKDYQRKLEKEIQTEAGGHWGRKAWKGINTGVDYMAAMSENSVRYATFVSQLETGKSVFDAVVYAKNITVNFNRKGKYAKGIGALFMFFNAGIQGVDNQLSLIDNRQGKDKKTIRKQRARFVAAKAIQVTLGYYSSYLLGSALSALIGDDGEEYTVSDYERRTNFIFPVGGKYVKIPIAIPDRPFYALGVMVGDMLDGKMTASDVTEEFASMFIDAYNPIQSDFIDPNDGTTHLKRLIPSSLKPMSDLEFNQDYMGLPISKKKHDDYTPDSQLGLKKTAWWAKAIAKELNEWGGGNSATPAGVDANGEKGILNWLDVSPGSIEHLLGSYSGGMGRIVSDVAALIGGDTEVRRRPIVNRFVGEPYEKRPSSDYYKLKEAIEFRDRTNRKTVANGEKSAIYAEEEFEQKAKTDQEWRRYLQQSDKQIKKLREELDNAPDGSAKHDQIGKEIARQQREFIQEYNAQDND